MIAADAASEIIGVPASAATSRIASELGVVDEPMMTSTLSSVTSLRALVTALVVSDASSSSTHLTFSPPMVAGSSSIVFFWGMPSDAAGPVADTVMPTVMSASAGAASANAIAAPSAETDLESFMPILLIVWRAVLRFASGRLSGDGPCGDGCPILAKPPVQVKRACACATGANSAAPRGSGLFADPTGVRMAS